MKKSGILILEGADASGKSTLARFLRDEFGARHLRTHPSKNQWRNHLAAYLRAVKLAEQGHLVVVERHWISECAYGTALEDRGGCVYPVAARCFDRLWLRAAALYVLCVPQDLKRQLQRHDEGVPGKVERFKDVSPVVAYYADLMKQNIAHAGDTYLDQYIRYGDFAARPDVVVYDLDQMTSSRRRRGWVINTLFQLNRWRNSQVNIPGQNLGGHAATARWVLVGETPSAAITHPRAAFPFVDREESNSAAAHLNRALHSLGVPETDLMFINAIGPELQKLVEQCPEKRYIALGHVAEDELVKLGVRPDYLVHPGWAKRFSYHEDYSKLLRGVLR